ncbi:MAG: AAA family ATPase [Pseudomonadota bacterium]
MTDNISPPFYILTGPPGAGKTALLRALSQRAATVPEAARRVLANERATGGTATGDQDPAAFISRMRETRIRDYSQASGLTLFDRGLPDLLAFCRFYGVSDGVVRAAITGHPYRPKVFFLPAWQAIYQQDAERRLDFAGAQAFGALTRDGYIQSGYQLVDVPVGPVAARAAFVQARLEG